MKNIYLFFICFIIDFINQSYSISPKENTTKTIPYIDVLSVLAKYIYPYHFKEVDYMYYRFDYNLYKKFKKTENNYMYLLILIKEKVENSKDLQNYITYTFVDIDFNEITYNDLNQINNKSWINSELVYEANSSEYYKNDNNLKIRQDKKDYNKNKLIVRIKNVPNTYNYIIQNVKSLPIKNESKKESIKFEMDSSNNDNNDKNDNNKIDNNNKEKDKLIRKAHYKKYRFSLCRFYLGFILIIIWIILFILYFLSNFKKKDFYYSFGTYNYMPHYMNI